VFLDGSMNVGMSIGEHFSRVIVSAGRCGCGYGCVGASGAGAEAGMRVQRARLHELGELLSANSQA